MCGAEDARAVRLLDQALELMRYVGFDAEDDVAGVGAGEAGLRVRRVPCAVVDGVQLPFAVPGDGLDLQAEVTVRQRSADPPQIGVVLATGYGSDDSSLYFHGSVASRSLVAASPRPVTDPEEKLAGLRCLTEQATPGQWDYARRPSRKELAATALLALPLDEASVKTRTGAPDDGDGEDARLGLWAGVMPLRSAWGDPEPDPLLPEGIEAPAHLTKRVGTAAD